MKLVELLIDYNENDLYEMANVSTKRTNLSKEIWISSKMGSHSARIKVSNSNKKFDMSDNFSVSISEEPKVIAGVSKLKSEELNKVFDWVKLNNTVLMKLWNGLYDDQTDAIIDLKKV